MLRKHMFSLLQASIFNFPQSVWQGSLETKRSSERVCERSRGGSDSDLLPVFVSWLMQLSGAEPSPIPVVFFREHRTAVCLLLEVHCTFSGRKQSPSRHRKEEGEFPAAPTKFPVFVP